MNERHGTGSLVRRLFADRRGLLSIRARNDYGGEHDLGDEAILLAHGNSSRALAFERVLQVVRRRSVRRVICVPYVSDDLVTSIVLGDAFQAPVCIWIMDDQNIVANNIPDRLMQEALEKAKLRLATHPEMRQAYERKFGLRFGLLPAVVPAALIRHRPAELPLAGSGARAALVGNVWSRTWLDRLCAMVSDSQVQVDWYGNHQQPALGLMPMDIPRLEQSGIRVHGILPERLLADRLSQHAFALVPTGMVASGGNEAAMARLSLPGRILFIAATSNTPVIVLGDEESSASRFVHRFGIGVTSAYEAHAFRRAVGQVTAPETQAAMRRSAVKIAGTLSSDDVAEWLFQSIDRGQPADDRFEELFSRDQAGMQNSGQ